MVRSAGSTSKTKRGPGRPRGRGRPPGRSSGTGRGRGRPRKVKIVESEEEEEHVEEIETSEWVDNMVEIPKPIIQVAETTQEWVEKTLNSKPSFSVKTSALRDKLVESTNDIDKAFEYRLNVPRVDLDFDVEAPGQIFPTFTSFAKAPPQHMLGLNWKQKSNIIADRIPNANVHMCETCRLPIRIYGRLISCKHVYCFDCASTHYNASRYCPRCSETVHRIEKNYVGSLHMCNHGGKKYGYDGCRRTYLSQRDLQAHIDHRHRPKPSGSGSISSSYRPTTFHGYGSGSTTTRAKADSQSHAHHVQSSSAGLQGRSSYSEVSTSSSSTSQKSRYHRENPESHEAPRAEPKQRPSAEREKPLWLMHILDRRRWMS